MKVVECGTWVECLLWDPEVAMNTFRMAHEEKRQTNSLAAELPHSTSMHELCAAAALLSFFP